jgi:uncharacterized membrane protein YcaP (DUF421 family)
VLVFLIIRMTGKRQLSDLQPFDLLITLLVADLASEPASDMSIPLLYGVVPIIALLFMQQLLAFLSLKFERVRVGLCGHPILLISQGIVNEHALHDARYSLNDLMEQLRTKDMFNLADVEYAILETNGSLSVLPKGPRQAPSYEALKLESPVARPPYLLIQDGHMHLPTLRQAGYTESWLNAQLRRADISDAQQVLFAFLAGQTLHIQRKARFGGDVRFLSIGKGGAA